MDFNRNKNDKSRRPLRFFVITTGETTMTNEEKKKIYDALFKTLTTDKTHTIIFGEFDLFIKTSDPNTEYMITHILNGQDWDKCESLRQDWDKKSIILYIKDQYPITLAEYIDE